MKRSTLLALALLAALGAYVYWFERGPVSEDEAKRVFDVEESQISRIELRDHDEPPVVVEKTPEGWRLLEPVQAAADASEMDLLAQNLATMGYSRAVAQASEVKLADFGLDAPKVRVRFETREGESEGVDFGSDTPTSGNQYARREGAEEILVVADYLSLNFQKTAWDLRDKRIFHAADDAAATRVTIDRRGRESIVLERDGDGFRETAPLSARADRLKVNGLVTRYRRAEMESVVSETAEGASDTGLSEPRFVLRIALEGDAAPLELEVGSEKSAGVVARTPTRPEIFLVDASLAGELDEEPAAFVEKKLFEGPTYEVTRLQVDGRRLELRTSGPDESWHELGPDEGELPGGAVQDLLFELSAASAEKVVLEPPELGPPVHTIALGVRDSESEDVLRVFNAESGGVYVRRQGDDVALELSKDVWDKVEPLLALAPEETSENDP